MDLTARSPYVEVISKSSPWLLFLLSAISGLILVFSIPPFQAPDELQHFYHSYYLASGHVVPERRGKTVGAVLPSSLPETVEDFLGSRALHTLRPLIKFNAPVMQRERARALDPTRQEFVSFSDSALVGPVAYAPQAVGVALGKLFGAAPVELLYCARLANLIVAVMATGSAFRWLGRRLTLAHCLFALPMAQAQFASAAPDSMMLVFGLVAAAGLMSPISTPQSEYRMWAVVLAACLALVSTKAVYIGAPILGAFIVAHRSARLGRLKQGVAYGVALVGLALATAAAWGVAAGHFAVMTRPTEIGGPLVDQAAQVAFVRGHPIEFLAVLVRTSIVEAIYFVTSTIGILGWLSVTMWKGAYVAALIALLLAFALPPSGQQVWPIWIRWLAIGAALGSYVVIQLAIYIRWTAVGGPIVEGVQGRYFLPFLSFLMFAQTPLKMKAIPERGRNVAILTLLGATMVAAQFAVIKDYY